MTEAAIPERPRLAAGVRLHFDRRRDMWVLLCPERVIQAEGPAHDILSRCDGMHSVAEIVDELARAYEADRETVAQDVNDLLTELAGQRLVIA